MKDWFQLKESDWVYVERLPQSHKQLLEAYHGEHSPSYIDLAQAYSIPIGTVKSRLNRARQKIVKWRAASLAQQTAP